jgi:hypothetical protein
MLPQVILIRQSFFGLGYSDFVSELSRDCEVCVVTIATTAASGMGGHDIPTLFVGP